VFFSPGGTVECLRDHDDFPAGDDITLPITHDFRVGDPVQFIEEENGNLDTALSTSTQYFVVAVTNTTAQVSATKGGSAITLNGDGGDPDGSGTADSAGHIKMEFGPSKAGCNITNVSLEISRDIITFATLPCGVGTTAATAMWAQFNSSSVGPPSGSGSFTLNYSSGSNTMGDRLSQNVMLQRPGTAKIKFFVNAVASSTSVDGELQPDLAASKRIEAEIGFNTLNNASEAEGVTTQEIGFYVVRLLHLYGKDLT